MYPIYNNPIVPQILINTPQVLQIAFPLEAIVLGCGRKADHMEEMHAMMRRMYMYHTDIT